MKLRANKGGNGYTTSYTVSVGSKEARDVGFLRADGTSRMLKKVSDTDNGTLTLMVDWDAENARED